MDDLISRPSDVPDTNVGDMISRQTAIEICDWYEHEYSEAEVYIRPIAEDIKKLPSAQPERCEDCVNFSKTRLLIPQVRHGHWIKGKIGFYCSVCRECGINHGTEYCPYCGARMDEGSNDDNHTGTV